MTTVQEDFEAALHWAQVHVQPGNPTFRGFTRYDPGRGGQGALCAMVLARGGFVEFPQPLSGFFYTFAPGSDRKIFSYTTRKDKDTSSATYLATRFERPLTGDPGDAFEWTGSQAMTPSVVALEFEGAPVFIDDIVWD